MTSTKRATDYGGLREEPQMETIIHYLTHNQELATSPNRQAKMLRNHPFMTQLDFYDMHEEQERTLDEQKREHEAQRISKEAQTSAAEVRATASSGSTASTAKYFFIGSRPDREMSERMDENEDRYKTERDDLQKDLAAMRANIKQEASRQLDENPGTLSIFFHSARQRAERSRSGHVKSEIESEPMEQEAASQAQPTLKQEKFHRPRSPLIKKETKQETPSANPIIKTELTGPSAEMKRILGKRLRFFNRRSKIAV